VPQGEQVRLALQDGRTPGRVRLVSYDVLLVDRGDGVVEEVVVRLLVVVGEVVLDQRIKNASRYETI
jgi:hypothetical protein